MVSSDKFRAAKSRNVIEPLAFNRFDARQPAHYLRFFRSETRCNSTARHQKVMRHIELSPQGSIHGLNMAGLFPHDLGAHGLRLRRIHLETLPLGPRLPFKYSLFGEFDHVLKTSILVRRGKLDVASASSVGKRMRCEFQPGGGFSAKGRRRLPGFTRRAGKSTQASQRQADARKEYKQADYNAKVKECRLRRRFLFHKRDLSFRKGIMTKM